MNKYFLKTIFLVTFSWFLCLFSGQAPLIGVWEFDRRGAWNASNYNRIRPLFVNLGGSWKNLDWTADPFRAGQFSNFGSAPMKLNWTLPINFSNAESIDSTWVPKNFLALRGYYASRKDPMQFIAKPWYASHLTGEFADWYPKVRSQPVFSSQPFNPKRRSSFDPGPVHLGILSNYFKGKKRLSYFFGVASISNDMDFVVSTAVSNSDGKAILIVQDRSFLKVDFVSNEVSARSPRYFNHPFVIRGKSAFSSLGEYGSAICYSDLDDDGNVEFVVKSDDYDEGGYVLVDEDGNTLASLVWIYH